MKVFFRLSLIPKLEYHNSKSEKGHTTKYNIYNFCAFVRARTRENILL